MRTAPAQTLAESPERVLGGVVNELREAISSGSSAEIWACEPILRRFHASGALRSWVNHQVCRLIGAPDAEAPTLIPLYMEECFTLSALVVARVPFGPLINSNRGLADLKDYSQPGLIYVAGPQPLQFELFEQLDTEDHDIFEKSKALRALGTQTAAPGSCMRVVPARTVLSDVRTAGLTVLLTLYGKHEYAVTWGYDPNTLLPVRPYSSALHTSRLEYALALLGEVGAFDAAASLESAKSLLDHPVYFVRWRALHALNELSATDALEALDRFCDDPHPHVRAAARKTKELSGIGGEHGNQH